MKIRFWTCLFSCISLGALGQSVLTLEESRALALKNNKAMQNSALETAAAREMKKNAYTMYMPKVSANIIGMQAINPVLDYKVEGGNLPVYDGNPVNLPAATQVAYFPGMELSMLQRTAVGVINIAQPVYVGGKIRAGNQLASLNVEVKEKQQQLTEKEILLKTEQQYWQLVSLAEKQKTLEKYELLLADVRKQVDDGFKAGLLIRNDVLKVQIKQSELEANKNMLLNGKKLATMQFCQTVGLPYDSLLVVGNLTEVQAAPQHYFIESQNALGARVENELLEKSVDAAQLQTLMKQGDFKPTIVVGLAGYHLNMLEKGNSNFTNGMAYASISIPISDLWNGKHSIKEHRLREQIAENTLKETKSLLTMQIEKAWVDLNQAWQQIQICQQSILQAEENLKVSQTGYNSGIVPLSDMLEAQALMQETADKLIEVKTQYRVAVMHYMQVTAR